MKSLSVLIIMSVFSLYSVAQSNLNDKLWMQNNSNIYYLNGNVGIGTTNPMDKLQVIGDDTDADGNVPDGVITIKNNNYSRFRTEAYSNTFFRNAQIQGIRGRGTFDNPQDVLPGDRVFGSYAHIIENKQLKPVPIATIEYYVGTEVSSGEIRFTTLSPGEEMRYDRMIVNQYGNVGIGTMKPASKLHVADGDIYMEDITKGIIMKSPDGNCWRGQLDNYGELHFTAVECPDSELQPPDDGYFSSKINIYPNPSRDLLKIKIVDRNKSNFYYKVYNVLGDIQDRGIINTDVHEVNIVKLASALYIIAFYNDKGIPVASKKFVKE